MNTPPRRRPEFRAWIDRQTDPGWGLLPLTHIAKGLNASDIIRDGRIEPSYCEVFNRPLAYFFYGRPAFRVNGEGSINTAATCPMCFIFNPQLIERAQNIHAFDTGAYNGRLYSHVIMDEMVIDDFSLDRDASRPNRLISTAFGGRREYFDADTRKMANPDSVAPQSEFLARAYIELIRSVGRNEPDDRVCSIEVTFGDPVPLAGDVLALVVPDIVWGDADKATWLMPLHESGVSIRTFRFLHGRSPEHHHALMEIQVRDYLESQGYI